MSIPNKLKRAIRGGRLLTDDPERLVDFVAEWAEKYDCDIARCINVNRLAVERFAACEIIERIKNDSNKKSV